MKKHIAILAGDGIGPEIMASALEVLKAVNQKFSHDITYTEGLIGGAAYDQHENHLPKETLALCEAADAILFGSVGGPIAEQTSPKWQNCEANALLGLRKKFNFSVNYRPAKVYPALSKLCPLRSDLTASGIDLLIIRELVAGIYFGEHSRFKEEELRVATDECRYDENQIRVAVVKGFESAMLRNKNLVSVDKANVLATSKLWREVVEETAKDYPDVTWQHMLVDNAVMQIIKNPSQFDVIVTNNMFGDILSDAAAVLPGSLGLTPSASVAPDGFAMYEPSGGSAPDIAGKDIANPTAQILSLAMLLKFSFGLAAEADCIEKAVEAIIKKGFRTIDLTSDDEKHQSTTEWTKLILNEIS